jgi:DNA helicase HerA-like ATPase
VLARLDTKQQAIIMGHAVPMPVVVKTRSYNEEFYRAILGGDPDADTDQARQRLGGGGKDRRIR